jgi:hypothetical protein
MPDLLGSLRQEHVSIATLPGMQDRTIVLDGCSKVRAPFVATNRSI